MNQERLNFYSKKNSAALILSLLLLVAGIGLIVLDVSKTKVNTIVKRAPLASTETPKQTPKPKKRPQESSIVEIWKRVAEKHSIPKSALVLVASDIEDVCNYGKIRFPALDAEPLEMSMDRFVAQYKEEFGKPHRAQKVGYWLVLCVADALRRTPKDDAERTEILQDYDQILVEVCAMIKSHVQKAVPDEQFRKWSKPIDGGLDQMRLAVSRHIRELNQDYLCPAFKEKLTGKARENVVHRFDNPAYYPKFDPENEDDYKEGIEGVLQDSINKIPFEAFFNCVEKRLNYNEFWGYMHFQANDSEGFWPMDVRLSPMKYMNDVKKWQRWTTDF
jgi:hypothetical protein